jgi:tetratricopeptide (TPR) repeat protein
MRKYFLLLFSVVILVGNCLAQNVKKINYAFRYFKLGNTLREAQQYDLSEKYLRMALQTIQPEGDQYWEAAIYESLGFLYKDQDNMEQATFYFNKAIGIFKELKMSLSERALQQFLSNTAGKEQLYAGVEVGSKGIKLSILGVQLNASGEVEYVLKADSSVNPEPGALTFESQMETAEAVKQFMEYARSKYGITPGNFFAVISSGLKTELDKKNKTAEFIASITPTTAPANFFIRSVTSAEEAELAVLGTVPPKRRFTTSLIDVGSSKTNGGYFVEGAKEFNAVYFPAGTKSFAKQIQSKKPHSITEFNHWAEILWKDSLKAQVKDELSRRPGLKNRAYSYLGGGVVWCIATFLYPNKVNDNYVEIKLDDVRRFRESLVTDYEKAIRPDLNSIQDENVRLNARNTINRAQNTYDQEALLAGAVWVEGLMNELNATQPSKRFFFSRYSYVGWISGYIAREVAEGYKKSSEQ